MNLPLEKNFIFNIKNNCLLFNNPELSSNKEFFCNLHVTVDVSTDKNSDTQFYDISYKWSYNDWSHNESENPGFQYHPFVDNPNFLENHNDGEIICKNELTDVLVKYLLMDFGEMKLLSGHTRAIDYKKSILESISLFWD